MKRRIATAVVLSVICLAFPSDSVIGSTLAVSYSAADPGDTEVLVTMLLENDVAYAGFEMTMHYDSSLLELDRIEPADRLSNQSEVGYYEFAYGKAAIVSFDMMGVTVPADSGIVLNVYFNVPADANTGVAAVSVSEVTAVTDNLEYDTVEVSNGAVLVGLGSGLVALTCPPDTTIALEQGVTELELTGFEIVNSSLESLSYAYSVTTAGPGTLADNGNPASLSGVTPLLGPGTSYSPPSPVLLIPYTTEYTEQAVTHHAEVQQHPGTLDSCQTTVTVDGLVPVELATLQTSATEDGILLKWSCSDFTDFSCFFVCRSTVAEAEDYPRLHEEALKGGGKGSREYSYLDSEVIPGTLYHYELEAVRSGGKSVFFGPYSVLASGRKAKYSLAQNFPNPFIRASGTTISYSVAIAGPVEIRIFDSAGRVLRTIKEQAKLGTNSTHWDGTGNDGKPLSSGIYYCTINAGEFEATKKLILLR